MKKILALFFLLTPSILLAQLSGGPLIGGSDGSYIGNTGDRLHVEAAQTGVWTSTISNTNGLATSANQVTQTNSLGQITANQTTMTATLGKIDADIVAQQPRRIYDSFGNTLTSTESSLNTFDASDGPVGPGAAARHSSLSGAIYNASTQTFTNLQQGALQVDPSGNLKITETGTSRESINRTDANQTVTTSGNTAAIGTQGFSYANFVFNVATITGTGATIQFHVQTSDDATNWVTYLDTPRLTSPGLTRYQAERQSGEFYRLTWDVFGTTPSVSFSITTTFKPISTNRKSVRFLYSDLDLTVNGNMSTAFSADDCHNVAVLFIRGADGGNNGTVQVFASNDQINWYGLSGNLAANPSTVNSFLVSNGAYRFYNLQVVAHTSAGTRVLDNQWSCN